MTIANAIIFGLIQGIAEFLPISSSGHTAIVQNLFGLTVADENHMLFKALLHLSTLIAICLMYRQDLVEMWDGCITTFTTSDRKLREKARFGARQLLMLLIGTLPMLLVFPIHNLVGELLNHTILIGIIMILTGFLLYAASHFLPGRKDGKNITIVDAVIIGVCQLVAVIPGMSRPGVTIAAAMGCGIDREYAVKFSILLSVPTVLVATIVRFAQAISYGVDVRFLPAYFIGTAVSMVLGVLSISVLQKIAKAGKVTDFSYYCWGAGFIAIILTAIL